MYKRTSDDIVCALFDRLFSIVPYQNTHWLFQAVLSADGIFGKIASAGSSTARKLQIVLS